MKGTNILVAEDSDDDAIFLKRTVKKFCPNSDVHIVPDGEEAICYLGGEGKYKDRLVYPFPDFVITDLKMPKKDGFEVLGWLKRHPQCRVIPVIIWTSSAMVSDVTRAYEMGANCYFQKPHQINEWNEVFQLIIQFWRHAQKPAMEMSDCVENPLLAVARS